MNRKIRSDSKLRRLPREQRARVDKWLFDKGMTYSQVAEACGTMFGLKISRSSVARYYERESLERIEEQRANAAAAKPLSPELEALSPAEQYEWLVNWMVRRASELVEAQLVDPDLRTHRELVALLKTVLMARREKTERELTHWKRKQFEIKCATECLEYLREQEREKQREKQRKERWADPHGPWPPEYRIPWYQE